MLISGTVVCLLQYYIDTTYDSTVDCSTARLYLSLTAATNVSHSRIRRFLVRGAH